MKMLITTAANTNEEMARQTIPEARKCIAAALELDMMKLDLWTMEGARAVKKTVEKMPHDHIIQILSEAYENLKFTIIDTETDEPNS